MTNFDFNKAINFFKSDKIKELSESKTGLRFLKLRSISRSDIMVKFCSELKLDITNIPKKKLLEFLFNSKIEDKQIENLIKKFYSEERKERLSNENKLINELYNLKEFDWGGLHQNSLEKTIVDNYIKKIQNFKDLSKNIDDKLYPSMKSYVLCSWYNHWTSIIIEDLFKDNDKVLPAIGLIKKIDFFIDNTPFDLKVTYLPEGYVKYQRKKLSLRPELTLMKKFSRDNKIPINTELNDARLIEDLWKKIKDFPNKEAKNLINELYTFRKKIISECYKDPKDLIKWLYENQGVRRFDASNRLFLILIDTTNFFASWELKRAIPLLKKSINDQLINKKKVGIEIDFEWEEEKYKSIADTIFVLR